MNVNEVVNRLAGSHLHGGLDTVPDALCDNSTGDILEDRRNHEFTPRRPRNHRLRRKRPV